MDCCFAVPGCCPFRSLELPRNDGAAGLIDVAHHSINVSPRNGPVALKQSLKRNMMKLSLDEARQLGRSSLQALGYNVKDAATITDHIIDSEERGYHYAGLARILSIADRFTAD